MDNDKERARYHIVSVRVSDQELEILERLSRDANTCISELMREALRSLAGPAGY